MPDKVRMIQRKDLRFDDYVRKLVSEKGWGHERAYAGVASQEEADEIRRKLRAAGAHVGVSVKAFWERCPRPKSCPAGESCRFHIRYTAYKIEDARRYKAGQSRRSA